MAEPTKQWSSGEQINASDLNANFQEALNNYRDFTYGETIAVNDALYLKASDGKVYKTDADFNDERIHNFIGFAKEAGALNDVKKVQIGGKVSGFSGLTPGVKYYLSNTPGVISSVPGTYVKKIGLAVSATELLIKEDILEGVSLPTRSLDTIYQNTTSKTLCVIVSVYCNSSLDANAWAGVAVKIGSSSPPTTVIARGRTYKDQVSGANGLDLMSLTFFVPNNYYYKVEIEKYPVGGNGVVTLDTWAEIN